MADPFLTDEPGKWLVQGKKAEITFYLENKALSRNFSWQFGLVISHVWGGGGYRKIANDDVLPDLNKKCLRAMIPPLPG